MTPEKTFDPGQETITGGKQNHSVQWNTVWEYGVPWGGYSALLAVLVSFLFTTSWEYSAFAGILVFVVMFGLTIRKTPPYKNCVRQLFGTPLGIGPSGVHCYHPAPIGDTSFVFSFGARQTGWRIVENVESATGTRFKVSYRIRNYRIQWPEKFAEAVTANGSMDAPEKAMLGLLDSMVRKFIEQCDDTHIFDSEHTTVLLAKIMTGETTSLILTDKHGAERTFMLHDGDPRKTVRHRLKEYGLSITFGGIDIQNIDEPDEIAHAKAEIQQAMARNKTIETRVEARAELEKKYGKIVNVDKVNEEVLVDAGLGQLHVVRNSTGGKATPAGDFTTGSLVRK